MNLIYENHYGFLNETEWKKNIKSYLNFIENNKIGKLLINSINLLKKNKTINIKNYSSSKIFQYPYCENSNKEINIYIPDSPYFIDVPVLNKKKLKVSTQLQSNDINNFLEVKPLEQKINNEVVKKFYKYECQPFGVILFFNFEVIFSACRKPFVVILFHELIHCYRILSNTESIDDEEAVIYGIKNQTSVIENILITENNFRNSLNLGMRISHDSRPIFVDKNLSSQFILEQKRLNDSEISNYFKKII